MQKRLRQKESTIVTALHPNLYADISEIALREYHFPEEARNFASASEIHNADDSEITQREGITKVQSNVVYASFEDYADASEIAPREYKILKWQMLFMQVPMTMLMLVRYLQEITRILKCQPMLLMQVPVHADASEITLRKYEILKQANNIAHASENYIET